VLLDLLVAMPAVTQEHHPNEAQSSPPNTQQLLRRLVQRVLSRLLCRSHANSNLSTSDVAKLLSLPLDLSADDRRDVLLSALLKTAYAEEGVCSLSVHQLCFYTL
jgi:hypothetical protein